MSSLRVRLLGDLVVEGCDPALLGRRQLRTLLKILALRHGQSVTTDALVDCLWGDAAPAKAADQVSVLVSRLRRVTGPERVRRTSGGYQLAVDWLDVDALDELADEADRRLAQGATGAARMAAVSGLALVRGPLLADETDAWWATTEVAHTEVVIARLRQTSMAAALEAQDWRDLEHQAQALLVRDPFDETALRALMRALAATGRSASALARYAELRLQLANELGIDPSHDTETLHTAILLGSDADAGPPLARTVPAAIPPGRAPQFEELQRHLAATIDGAAGAGSGSGRHVVLLEGEAGSGKSHLLRAWLASLEGGPHSTASVSCDELGQGLPLQPLFDALLELARGAGADADVVGPDAVVLGPFLGLGPATTDATQIAALTDRDAGQALLFGAVRNVLRRLAQHQPMVLILDDLHLADSSTLRWLQQADRHLTDVPVLLVGALRPEEGLTVPGASTITLGPVSADDASAIVGADAAAAVYDLSAGNPLFLVELAAAPDRTELPPNITRSVEARCARAGPAAATLHAAAVLGPDFDLDLLLAVTGAEVPTLLDHLEEGVRRRFLVEVGSGFAFSHALVREALAATVGAARSAFIHREAARALAARPHHDPMVTARHARLGGEVAEASALLVTAAQLAVARFDHADALRLVDEAIALQPSTTALVERARILTMLGRYGDATVDIEQATLDSRQPEALEVAAWAAHFERRFDAALALADEGAATAVDDDDLRSSCQSLGGWVALVSGDLEGAGARLDTALEQQAQGANPMAESWQAWLRVNQGRSGDALALAHPAAGKGLAAYRFPNAYALMAACMAQAMMGQADDALHSLDLLEHDIARMSATRWIPRPRNLRAWIARNLGQPGEADDANAAAIEASQETGMTEPLANALLDLASGRLLAGDLAGADERLHQAAGLADTPHAFRWRHLLRGRLLQARLDHAAGHFDAALAGATELADEAGRVGTPRYAVQATLVAAMAAQQIDSASPMADRSKIAAALGELDRLAGLESWWITAEMARAFNEPRWHALARQRVAALVVRAGPYAASLERAAAAVLP